MRVLRDVYLSYWTRLGREPNAMSRFLIFRLAIERRSVHFLRTVMVDYLMCTQVDMGLWRKLFGFVEAVDLSVGGPAADIRARREISSAIQSLLYPEVFSESVVAGGPFGRRSFALQLGLESSPDRIAERLAVWDNCKLWTEGLSKFFDCTQAELFSQNDLLPSDSLPEEPVLVNLSRLEVIAYEHLVHLRRGEIGRNLTSERWLALLQDLDSAGLRLDAELHGKAQDVLAAVRRKGLKISSWVETYTLKATVSMEDGKHYTLKREVTHTLHNAAKRAKYQIDKG